MVWKLTNGAVHVTDYTNASRTMLYNIRDLKWDEKLLQRFDIPVCMLPKVCNSSEIYGYVQSEGVQVLYPVLPVTNKRRCLGRHVLNRVRQKIPMAPAVFC